MTRQFAELLSKKSFEICYAALRVAGIAKSAAFSNYLESYGFMLLDAAIRQEKNAALHALEGIRHFSHIGASAGFLSQKDADILIAESAGLNAAIQESGKEQLPDSGIDAVFHATQESPAKPVERIPRQPSASSVRSQENAQERQRRIIEKVRQSGNSRLKDIQEALPGVSERTLRYDLQELMAMGKIDRLGAGGPSTFYKIKEEVIALPGADIDQV